MKPALVGVITRNGQPATSSGGNVYTPDLGGWVIPGTLGDKSAIAWSELQTTYAMNLAGTLVENNPIDQGIAALLAYNAANGTNYGGFLRLHAGWRAPGWAGGDNGSLGTGKAPVGLDGVASFPVKDPQFNDGGWCPPFWLPNFLQAYARLEAALIAKYDSCPVLLEVLLSSQMTIYNEPFLRQILNTAQVTAMRNAGFYAENAGTQRQVVDAVLNGTTTVTSATAAFVAGDVGSLVVGPGIPAGATIATRTNGTTVVLSVAATKSASGQTFTIMDTGTISDQYLQLIDMSERVGQGLYGAGGWLQTRVGYDFNPYQCIEASSTPSDPVTGGTVSGATSFTKIAMLHGLAMMGVQQFSPNNSSDRVVYLSGNGAYQNMLNFMGALGTIGHIQVAATTGNIGGSTTGRLGGNSTLSDIVTGKNGTANGLARTLAGAMLLHGAGSVELPEGWWPGGNAGFDTTPADIGVLTALAPVASSTRGSGTIRQNLVPSATSASATSLSITSGATLAGSTLVLQLLVRGASASSISSITGATFTLLKSVPLSASVDFGLLAVYACVGAPALAANAIAVNFGPTGSCAALFSELSGSGIAYEGGNITAAATTTPSESYTTTNPGDIVLAAFGFDNSTFTINAGTLPSAFTNATLLRGLAPSLGCSLQGGSDIPAAAGAVTYGATLSAAIQWAACVVAFSVAGGNPPGTPTGVTATPGNTNAVVSFTAPYNGGSAITSTLIKTYLAGVHQAGLDQTISGTGTSKTVTGLTNGTAYQSSATCTNANGAGPESALSAPYTPVASATVPSTPAAPIGNPLNNEIDWTWVAPNNGGAAITSYTITETVVGGGSLTPVVINDGPPPSTTYDDTANVSNGVAYTATITATNSVGTSAASPASLPYQPSSPTVQSTVTTNYPPAAHPAISAKYAALLQGKQS